jgi:hypothetical protein
VLPGPHLKGGYTVTGVPTVDPMAAFYKRQALLTAKAARGAGKKGKGKGKGKGKKKKKKK